MKKDRRFSRRTLLLSLVLSCYFGLATGRAEASQPEAPAITPGGPVVAVNPGKILTLRAHSEGAEAYEWRLQGKGSLEETKVPVAVYKAPEEGGATAVLTVVARNAAGTSPAASVTVTVRSRGSVPLDSLGIPAGWMSPGDPSSSLSLRQGKQCRPGSRCIELSYKPGGGWGGIYWWPPGCGPSGTPQAWESARTGTCAIDLRAATGMHEVTRLSFWARGSKGGEVVEFKIGGRDILPIPGRSLGSVTLKPEWTEHAIELGNIDPTKFVGLFVWTATDLDNPQGATFSLQDLRFEGLKP